jgi:hypothetical protein
MQHDITIGIHMICRTMPPDALFKLIVNICYKEGHVVKHSIKLVHACYWTGAEADAISVLPLLFPGVAAVMFGLDPASVTGDSL